MTSCHNRLSEAIGSYLTVLMMSLACQRCLFRQARVGVQSWRPPTGFQLPASARLLNSLAILEQKEGKIQNGSLSAVTAAGKLGGPVTAFVAGSGIGPVAQEAAKVKGIEKVVIVDSDSYDKVMDDASLSLPPVQPILIRSS